MSQSTVVAAPWRQANKQAGCVVSVDQLLAEHRYVLAGRKDAVHI